MRRKLAEIVHRLRADPPRCIKTNTIREKEKSHDNSQKMRFIVTFLYGRSDGIRTHGLLVPNQARYQLRYTPIKKPQQQSCCGVVGDERIELPRAESESAALPLCESPSHCVVGACPQRLTIIAAEGAFVNSFFAIFSCFLHLSLYRLFLFSRVDKRFSVAYIYSKIAWHRRAKTAHSAAYGR